MLFGSSVLTVDTHFVLQTLENGFFDHLVDVFCREVDLILASEDNMVLNLAIGLEASELMTILQLYLSMASTFVTSSILKRVFPFALLHHTSNCGV
jgi:hypothetical protein